MRHRPSASPPEITDTMTVVAEQAGRRSHGQGFLRSAELRSEIEQYAMAQAMRILLSRRLDQRGGRVSRALLRPDLSTGLVGVARRGQGNDVRGEPDPAYA